MYNPFSLEGKTILVTGASSGIGKATAIECSRMGARVIALGRNEERLDATLSECADTGCEKRIVELTDNGQTRSLVDDIPAVDGVVCSAGILTFLPFQFATPEKIETEFRVNVFSAAELIRLLLRKKRITRKGSIVFLSSIGGTRITHIGNGIYGATKAALAALTKNLAVELAQKGIRVNCLMPGMTDTPLIHNGDFTEEQLRADMDRYPLGRYGRPEEIAYGAIYLLSDASSFTTGAQLVIDGGFTLL